MRQLTEETFAELYPRVAAWAAQECCPPLTPHDSNRSRSHWRRHSMDWPWTNHELVNSGDVGMASRATSGGSSVESLRMDPSNPSVPRSLDSPWRSGPRSVPASAELERSQGDRAGIEANTWGIGP